MVKTEEGITILILLVAHFFFLSRRRELQRLLYVEVPLDYFKLVKWFELQNIVAILLTATVSEL